MSAILAPPDRSLEQRMTALARANVVRTRRARLKRDLKAGRTTPLEILCFVPEWAGTMKVYDLLLATPKLGRVKVAKILKDCAVSPSKSLAGLSKRQRLEIAATLSR